MRMIENGMLDYTEKTYRQPVCPICGETCETLYKDRNGDVFACDECVETVPAWEEDYE